MSKEKMVNIIDTEIFGEWPAQDGGKGETLEIEAAMGLVYLGYGPPKQLSRPPMAFLPEHARAMGHALIEAANWVDAHPRPRRVSLDVAAAILSQQQDAGAN